MGVSKRQNSKQSKTEFRRAFRTQMRLKLLPNEIKAKTERLNQQLVALLEKRSGVWAAFQPIEGEPDIRPALSHLSGIDWVYPRVECEYLSFHRLGAKNRLLQSTLGILEPDPDAEDVALDQIQGFLVPGLAFDSDGMRMGRGRGFYDRTLGDPASLKALKIGIAFQHQIVSEPLPAETHDISMDLVLTDVEVLENPNSISRLRDFKDSKRKLPL